MTPTARHYLDLLDRYLSLPEGDESLDSDLNAAHDALTPEDVESIRAWHAENRFCDRCPGRGVHLMSCIAYKGGHVDLHEPFRRATTKEAP